MNYKMISRFLSLICLAEAVFMLPALAISIYDGQAKAILGFGATISIAISGVTDRERPSVKAR